MRTPVVVVTGVDPVAVDATAMSLAWDLPRAVSVRHEIDPESQVLTRTVSDQGGVVEQEVVHLEHACVTCALREDVLPTLERAAQDSRWGSIVSVLPLAAEADQLVHVLGADTRLARRLRLSGVVAALGSGDVVRDLTGEDLLSDRGSHTAPDDDRGVAEVACAQVELADLVVLGSDPAPSGLDLVRALARPGAAVVPGADQVDGARLVAGRHRRRLSSAWSDPGLDGPLPSLGDSAAWRVELASPRAFHPDRLLDEIERLGAGPHRSRGVFWVPTRPGDVLEWSGAGGHLSIGGHGHWGRRAPMSRLLVTGLGPVPVDLGSAFDEVLLTSVEQQRDPRSWAVLEDGLEPWLGDIRDAA